MNAKDMLRLGVPLGEATHPPLLPSAFRFDAASRYGATSGLFVLGWLTF